MPLPAAIKKLFQYRGLEQITPLGTGKLASVDAHDVNGLPYVTKCLYVADEGNLKITDDSGNVRTQKFIAGYHPIQLRQIFATGSDAGTLATAVAWYF